MSGDLSKIIQAWGKILNGESPSLSIEITRECPLKCPGCYAYDDAHLGGGRTLRELNDRRGTGAGGRGAGSGGPAEADALVDRGGRPAGALSRSGSADPEIAGARGPRADRDQRVSDDGRDVGEPGPELEVVVSIDGLQPEHDVRRAPATYERILKNIEGQKITVHCTITGQMMKRPGYLEDFLQFWTPREEIRKVWFSLFTPQVGDRLPEMLSAEERTRRLGNAGIEKELSEVEMPRVVIEQFAGRRIARRTVFLRRRRRRCRRTWRRKSRRASLAGIRIADRAGAWRRWGWRPWVRTSWVESLRWGRSSRRR